MENLLFKDESVVSRSPDDTIVLTTHRIRHTTDNKKIVSSIMLDNIDSVRFESESRLWLIALAIASFIVSGIFIADEEASFAAIAAVAGITCILMYVASRRHVITIRSASAAMIFQTKGMSTEQVLHFLNQVEEARKNFIVADYAIK